MPRQTLSLVLLTVSILFLALALVTLLPFPSSKMSDLGYSALCPFAPWSTLVLLLLGGVTWVVRSHISSRPR
jgi:hypothetical protein